MANGTITGFDYGDLLSGDNELYYSAIKDIYNLLKTKSLPHLIPGVKITAISTGAVRYAIRNNSKTITFAPGTWDKTSRALFYKGKMVGGVIFIKQNIGTEIRYNMPVCLSYIDPEDRRRAPYATFYPLRSEDRIRSSAEFLEDRMKEHLGPPNEPKWIEFGDWLLHKFGNKQYELFLERIKLLYN